MAWDTGSEGKGKGKLEAGTARFEDIVNYWVALDEATKKELVAEATKVVKRPDPAMRAKLDVVYADIKNLWGFDVRGAIKAASMLSAFKLF
ncbi:uncharacterized protein AMSG_06184 [Thecamonas trahens ATCC 50062]|uniref:Uncharacterized protein n=1 Tax=Thecamonas trahens ATCC 50062 TaxID=461836 RepID=A0A0L0DC17_THETB|nr:hypothetical protein AMSG_06184 [Thecamonas trahens ATCC 50062]KNC49887.1 hypothetical protein AMSG_06184 [Thecamonas trahens ATCC 50062]|eukprot:XP_013757369.1 hypothetical protein AMSG_06184 [Thecamonas trahens ATCC 50062]